MHEIRSVSFDTSFLLKEKPEISSVFKKLRNDQIQCYITSTVISELNLLKQAQRINNRIYKMAMTRWKLVDSKIIDFRNNFLSKEFKKECMESMGDHHGVKPEDIINDCNILVVSLKNGVDLFLSEDYHFTSKITNEVIEEVTNNACKEYHLMCGEEMFCIDTGTFLEAYQNGKLDLDIVKARGKIIRKPSKYLGNSNL